MIEVIYWPEYSRVTVTGHAHAGEKGEDLVCCAASAYAQSLAENVRELEQSGGVRDACIRLEDGSAEISCKPVGKYAAIVEIIFRACMAGFRMLARETGLVRYEERGK